MNLDKLNAAVEAGRVRVQTHPEFPELSIYNYTESVQFSNSWDEVTLACRGLIMNTKTGEVVARPWNKFFNYGQAGAANFHSKRTVEVTDKMDGSLGILYRRPDGELAIATRGSFASEQAIHGSNLLDNYNFFSTCADRYTFLFEIIYPENRIVVDYGGMDELVLLGGVDIADGNYLSIWEAELLLGWRGKSAQTWYTTFGDALKMPNREGKEGYVIRSGNDIVKIKQQDYIELHRIVTNLNERSIWKMVYQDDLSLDEIIAMVPDELFEFVETTFYQLDFKYLRLLDRVKASFRVWKIFVEARIDNPTRKDYAEAFKCGRYPGLYFKLLDGRSIHEDIAKMIRP